MANQEDILREETFKGQCDDVEHRVFYTLTHREILVQHRTAKALALIIGHLHKKQLLTDSELDDLLLECI